MTSDYKIGDRLIIPDIAFDEEDISTLYKDDKSIILINTSNTNYVILAQKKKTNMYIVIGYTNKDALMWLRGVSDRV